MTILAIDPGCTESAWCLYRNGEPVDKDKWTNDKVMAWISSGYGSFEHAVVEMVASYGMAVGKDVFETVYWIGRFAQAIEAVQIPVTRVYRRDVKMHLCGANNAKDANIRQALIDRFGPGKEKAIGRKASPGPLYGFSADCWAALALAVTFSDGAAVTPVGAEAA